MIACRQFRAPGQPTMFAGKPGISFDFSEHSANYNFAVAGTAGSGMSIFLSEPKRIIVSGFAKPAPAFKVSSKSGDSK